MVKSLRRNLKTSSRGPGLIVAEGLDAAASFVAHQKRQKATKDWSETVALVADQGFGVCRIEWPGLRALPALRPPV